MYMAFNLFDLLLPKEKKYFNYLTDQTSILLRACELLNECLIGIHEFSDEELLQYFTEIKVCESQGDALEREILDELNKSFITPIDREDIHTIVTNVDTALDILNGTARKLEVYQIKNVPKNLLKLSKINCFVAQKLHFVITLLKSDNDIQEIVREMHKAENEADELFHQGMLNLFNHGYDAFEVMKMKEIYERIESVIDSIDHIGKLIRGIKVKIG